MPSYEDSYPRNSKQEQKSHDNRKQNRTQVQNLLRQSGLSPSDYTYNSSEGTTSPREQAFTGIGASSYTSSFHSSISKQSNTLNPQSKVLVDKNRSIRYVQQSPTGHPTTQGPISFANSDEYNSEFVPYSTVNQLVNTSTAPQHSNHNIPSIRTPTASEFLPGPPPPPQQTLTAKTPSQESEKMSRSLFSPRRTPPPPPTFTTLGHETAGSAEHYLHQINSQEVPPVKVVKPNTQNVVYRKEIRIRYLQPPTPPPPAPIIIREKHEPAPPPESPLLIRERKPEARTPPPLTIRERPPTPPAPLEPYVIEKTLPAPPQPPRQIIIERLPTPPPKPRTVIFEKWLPYKKLKRPVLLQKAAPIEPPKPTRNVIIEYEPLKAFTVRRVIEEGVFRVDPNDYLCQGSQHGTGGGDVRVVERIEDLPPPSDQLMRVLEDYNQPSQHIPNCISTLEARPGSEHISSSLQKLLAGARPVATGDHLTSISRASSLPAHKSERVLSTGFDSSAPSPSGSSVQCSRSKVSTQYPQSFTPRHSPARSHIDDIY